MIAELRRRAYLSAMQVASWLPRVELPFAAPSRPELLQPLVEAEPEVVAVVPQAVAEAAPAYEPPHAETPVAAPVSRPKIEVPRPAPQGRMAKVDAVAADAEAQVTSQPTPVAPPRFALQLLRAGACAVLVELPTGEALPMPTARAWFERYPAIPLINAYGPAECSDDVAFQPLHQAPEEGGSVAIGSPTAGAELYVLGRDLNPLPVGVPGELAIGGIGVSRGYLADPARTAASFVPNPFGAPGSRLYLSGDLARWRADGVLEYLGRKDFQLKLRGFRIEPGEIEACLLDQAAVTQAVVIADQGPRGTRLVAYLVLDSALASTDDLREQLRTALKARLPDYMVPSHWHVLPNMPLSPNGKLDRKALPALEAHSNQRQYQAPETPLQVQLAGIWSEVLGVALVGLEDDFFELGGHSLLVINVVSRIQLDLGRSIAPHDLFQHPTLGALALHLHTTTTAIEDTTLDTLEAWLDEMEEI